MKIVLATTISPTENLDVYKSLDRVEEFLSRLLSSETAKELARECKIEEPSYTPSSSKLHRALGFSWASGKEYSFSCWEQEAGSIATKVRELGCLAGRNGAAEHNGGVARAWKQSGGEKIEEEAGVHRLYRNGQLLKTLWIEAERRSS